MGADHDDAENVVGSVDQAWSGCLFSSGEFRVPGGGGTIAVRDKASGEIFALAGLASRAGRRRGGGRGAARPAGPGPRRPTPQRAGRAAGRGRGPGRAGQAVPRADHARDRLHRGQGRLRDRRRHQRADRGGQPGVPGRSARCCRPATRAGSRCPSGSRSGLVGVITPWNFPLVLGMRVIAPALALGNAVLVKPSPETPASGGLAIAELFADAGAPPGILQDPARRRRGRASGWSRHPDVAMIHFTGSTATGRQIAARPPAGCSRRCRWNSAATTRCIVLDDADLEQATMIGAWSSLPLPGPDVHHRRAAHRAARRSPSAYLGRAGRPGRRDHRRQHPHRRRRARPDDQHAVSWSGPSGCWTRRSPRAPGWWPAAPATGRSSGPPW